MQLSLFQNNEFLDEDRDSYSTPLDVYDPLHREFNFQWDAAATNKNKKCYRYFGPDHYQPEFRDALTVSWGNVACFNNVDPPTFWLNPPYSNPLIKHFMRKAYEESLQGSTVVCLVIPSTCSEWWHKYALKGELRFLPKRVNFVPPPGVLASHNNRDSVIVIFRPPVF